MKKQNVKSPILSRRSVLMGFALVGGALLVGPVSQMAKAVSEKDFGKFGPFLKITSDGIVTVISKHCEFGQGSHTGLAIIVAEELDADWQKVRVEMAPANMALFGHTKLKIQITGGSSTISNSWDQLRRVGASTRAAFVQAASELWNVPAVEIMVDKGVVSHVGSGKTTEFGKLLRRAVEITLPAEPVLKTPDMFKLIGTENTFRLDGKSKTTGTEIYTEDVQLPHMLVAMVVHSPRFGGKLVRFEAQAALALSGVVDVFEIPSGVAVVAKNTYMALKGRAALQATWDDSAAEMRSDFEIMADHKAIANGDVAGEWGAFETVGDIGSAFKGGYETMACSYDFPYLAHSAMEPMNCVAQVEGKRVKLTFGAQSQTGDQRIIAAIIGCKPDEVEIETLHAGGSFGRRSVAISDYQSEAVYIAKKIGGFTPIKLIWTREDDSAGGSYRAMAYHKIKIEVDKSGYPLAWQHRLVSESILAGTQFAAGVRNGVDRTVVEGVQGSPYFKAIAAVDAQVSMPKSPIPVLWLRSVGSTHTAMAMEHTIDQLARRADINPVEYRRVLYKKAGNERHLRMLDFIVEKSGWGTPIEDGWVRGMAIHECFNTVVANVVELRMEDGEPHIRRVILAVDCGLAISPDQVRAQMEGGVYYGLSFALYGEVKIDKGIVQNTNFDTSRVLRMEDAPIVETHIMPSANRPSGAGEPGTPVVGPAVANAILALTGKATVSLPFVKS
ncbi:MAG: xanthine dehydrogenase family protein molybdopterin-binding subunit [Emcibacter sp.]|nr:xanthine dehydrogenase family protein molybdopterin-binding subunit [Emcibacter sp.]